MSHLWEWLRGQSIPIPGDCEALDITEWMRFYWMNDKDEYDMRDDFPNIAPPFRCYFMFGEFPAQATIGGEAIATEIPRGAQLGVLFESVRLKDGGFSVAGTVCGGSPGSHSWSGIQLFWRVKPDGSFMSPTDEIEAQGGGALVVCRTGTLSLEEMREAQGVITPYLLATSLLHCKNVSARRAEPSRQIKRNALRHGLPLYTYSVLDVAPMARILGTAARAEDAGLKRAIHVCRGHFKDYRDGRGLFGQYKGLFWWEQSLRGSGPSVHDKLYRVTAGDKA